MPSSSDAVSATSATSSVEVAPGAEPARERSERRAPSSRHVPAAVARELWERDGGACTFVGAEGRRCASTNRLKIHLIDPFALGGATSALNLTLHSESHNRLAAERDFGADFMSLFRNRS